MASNKFLLNWLKKSNAAAGNKESETEADKESLNKGFNPETDL